MWTDLFPGKMFFFGPFKNCHGQVFSRSTKCFSTASHPDEALPVFALFLTAGVAACRRRAGRAGRHLPVCWVELATRQVHEDAQRSAQLASALGTSLAGAHHEPPRAPAGHPLAAPGLVVDQEKPSTRRSHTRSSPPSRRLVPPPRPLKTSTAAALPSAARPTSTPSPATGSLTCWTSGEPSDDGTCSGACAKSSAFALECSTGSTRTLPTAGNGARHEQQRLAGEARCRPPTRHGSASASCG